MRCSVVLGIILLHCRDHQLACLRRPSQHTFPSNMNARIFIDPADPLTICPTFQMSLVSLTRPEVCH
jgi:hypothetical protein